MPQVTSEFVDSLQCFSRDHLKTCIYLLLIVHHMLSEVAKCVLKKQQKHVTDEGTSCKLDH